jgi:O-antigen/teichoic acid export membrane protein
MIKDTLHDSLTYGLASLLSKGLAIFLLPIYTRVLTARDYGAYDLLLTLGTLANLIVALEISQGLARYWADTKDQDGRRKMAGTALWFSGGMYGLFLVLGLVFSAPLSRWFLGAEGFLSAFQLGLGFIAANGIYYLLLNQFRWELRSSAYAVASFAFAFATLVFAVIFCFWLGMGLEGVMLSQLLAASCAALLSWGMLRSSFTWSFDARFLRRMLAFSAPLVPAGLAIFISLYVNRVALSHYASLDEVGLFGIASRLAGVAGLIMVGIQSALTPLVYQHFQESETPARIAMLFNWFLAVAMVACLGLTLTAEKLLLIFTTPEYMAAASLVAYLAPALLLSQMYIFAPGIGIRKKTYWQLLVAILAAGVSMLGNWLLVPRWGGTGAAVATLLSALVFFVAWVGVSQRLYPIPYAWARIVMATLGFGVCVGLGLALDAMEASFWVALSGKVVLSAMLLSVILGCGLVSLADIRALAAYLRQSMGRES